MTSKDDFIEYATYHTIADFANLSIKDIIALQFLVRYQDPIVRHLLYTEVKQFLEFKEEDPIQRDLSGAPDSENKFFEYVSKKRKLYPSSFYNMLENLKEKGLVKFRENESGKIPPIEDTPFTNYVPQLLLKFLINNNVMVSQEYREEFFQKFKDKIQNLNFNRVLSIWLSEYVVIPIFKQLSEYAKEHYVLPKTSPDEDLSGKLPLKNVKIADIANKNASNPDEGKQIEVPEDWFDGVIIPVYKRNPKFHDMSRIDLLRETVRVMQSKGLLVIVAIAEIPPTENVFLNELIKLYDLSLKNRIFNEQELKEDMDQVNLMNLDIFRHQGLLIGMGRKP